MDDPGVGGYEAGLTTDRLTLSPLRVEDARDMQEVLADPALYTFTGGSPPSLPELERRYRAQTAGSTEPGVTWHNWIVRRRPSGSAIGFVQATATGKAAEIAWLIGVPWQRQGFATEAAAAVMTWLGAQGTQRLVAHLHPDHLASATVAGRLGLTATGTFDEDGEQIWSGDLRADGEGRDPA